MIEVDSVRRNYSIGPYEPSYLGQPHPLTGAAMGVPGYDGHRVLVHWPQPPGLHHTTPPIPPQSSSTATATTAAVTKSDEDDDEDDEDRPFTPPPPRERLSYTRYQLELLNGIYEEVRYPNSTQKQLIAKRVGITRDQVKIWFQNRRRKDVIGNTNKSKGDKSCDTSTSSASSGMSKDSDSRQNSPAPEVMDNESSSSDENLSSSPQTDSNEQVVPTLVMKSVITELVKFKNDPLKGKKNRKKKKKTNKKKEQEDIKKGLVSTIISGSYDMINPPNQVTPTAFFEKVKSGFNHSKSASAFASPRDALKPPAQISRISSTTEHPTVSSSKDTHKQQMTPGMMSNSYSAFPFGSSPGNFISPEFSGLFQSPPNSIGCDLPVLSELMTYKSGMQSSKEPPSSVSTTQTSSSAFPTSPLDRRVGDKQHKQPFQPHPGMVQFSSGRPFNGIYPYPFLAEQPMVLSSLRQPDHIFRPAAHYPMSSYSDDPYQPLIITSLSNPYYSPPVSWQTTSTPPVQPHSTPSTYTQM